MNNHFRAFSNQRFGNRAANPHRTAGYQCPLFLEYHVYNFRVMLVDQIDSVPRFYWV